MPAPVPATRFGGDLYQQLEPVAAHDGDNDWALLRFCDALGAMFEQVNTLVRDTPDGPGWTAILDVDRAPAYALPWLGQIVGVTTDPHLTVDAQRQQIRDTVGFRRGTPAAIVAAAQPHLTGSKTVRLYERSGSAYQLTVLTLTEETADPAVVEAAIRAQKPAGIVLTYVTVSSATYEDLLTTYATYEDVLAAYLTYQGVLDDNPGT